MINYIFLRIKESLITMIFFIILWILSAMLYLKLVIDQIENDLTLFEYIFGYLVSFMFLYSIHYLFINITITMHMNRAGQQQDFMESTEEEKFKDDKSLANPNIYFKRKKAITISLIIGLSLLLISYIYQPNLRSLNLLWITLFNISVFLIYFTCMGNMIFKNQTNFVKLIKFRKKAKILPITLPEYPNDIEFTLVIGEQHGQKGDRLQNPKWFSIKDKGLYAGILCVGDTGSGKTTSIGFPILQEAIKKGLGGLVLDAGIQFVNFAQKQMALAGRTNDLIIIEKKGDFKYNPIAKKDVSSIELAGAIFQVIKNLSPSQSVTAMDSFWEQSGISFCMAMIELLRLFHVEDQHVSLDSLYRLNINEKERNKVLSELDAEIKSGTTPERTHRIEFVLNYFRNYWPALGSKLSSSISAQFNAVVSMFSSDFDLNNTFCPGPDEQNLFQGFNNDIFENKIVLLKMPAKDISGRVIGTFLKLDFQRSVLRRSEGKSESSIKKPVIFLCDEAHNFVSSSKESGDAIYLAESRKNLPINVYMSQSIDSFLEAFKDDKPFNVFLNLLRTKIIFSQEGVESQKISADLCGKSTQYKRSYTTSEAGRDTKYSYLAGEFIHAQSAQTRAVAKNEEIDYIFQPHDFRNLPCFVSIVSPFTGDRKLLPRIVYTKPIFINSNGDIERIDRETWFSGDRSNYQSYLEFVKDEDGDKISKVK